MTIWHYHGGCQVGRVVDTEYRVLGVDALRVIDGSTFNASPGTNPQATVMLLGSPLFFCFSELFSPTPTGFSVLVVSNSDI
jgi:hypothetical protein